MELDFESVRALSSPTRIRILSAVMEKERTPTELSRELGKSKSTISSHLSHLEDAGLVVKDAEEGRRRVTYAASRKAEAIVKGKERKVKFSVVSSVVTGIAGIVLLGNHLVPFGPQNTFTAQSQSLAMESGGDAAATATREAPGLLASEPFLLGLGAIALVLALVSILYALVLHRLPQRN